MKKQSFITGAFLLAAATALGKIFSAVFKIPLDRFFLHAEGMAVFNGAYNIYMFFYAAATAGIPMAISHMVAFSDKKEHESDVVSTAFTFSVLFLSFSAALIFIFSDTIARFTGMPDSALALKVMAPALVFCSVTASLRGFFQGKRAMIFPAASQTADSFGKFFAGIIMAYIFLSKPLSSVCAAAMAGVPFGAFLSALILTAAFFKSGFKLSFKLSFKVLKHLLFLAVPITLTASMHPVFNAVDTLSVVPFLTGIGFSSAREAFGCLSRAATLYALPVSIASAVAASALPAVAEGAKNNSEESMNQDASMALRLTLLISLPVVAGFMAIPKDILEFLFESNANYHTLAIIAPSSALLSAGALIACILQGLGKTKYTVIAAVSAICAKAAFNIAFMYFFGINGAALSTTVSYLIFDIALLKFLKKDARIRFSFSREFTIPLLCAFLCFASAYVSSLFFPIIAVIMIAAAVYMAMVFATGAIKREEINQIFSVDRIKAKN